MINKYYLYPDDMYTDFDQTPYDHISRTDPYVDMSPYIIQRLRSTPQNADTQQYEQVLPQDDIRTNRLDWAISHAIAQDFNRYLDQKEQQDPYYTIRKNQTLGQIAAEHGMTYQELAKLNGIADPNLIRAGQQLRLNDSVSNTYRDYGRTRRVPIRPVTRRNNTINNKPNNSNQAHLNKDKQYVNLLDEVVVTGRKPTQNNKSDSKLQNSSRYIDKPVSSQIKKPIRINRPIKQVGDYKDIYKKERESYFQYKKGELPNGAYSKYITGKNEGTLSKDLSYQEFLKKYNYPNDYEKRTTANNERRNLFAYLFQKGLQYYKSHKKDN